uniref:Protein BANP n=1 Tax=Sus scrofa TaxID=9823 RepID=A0A8D0Y1P6_PIG
MMSEQDLADVVQITVEELSPDHPVVLENHVVADEDEPALKRQRLEINCQDPSIKSFLCSINQTICLRLDSIEAKLQALEATCKSLEEKLDLVTSKQHSPIQVPMVAGSPLGATQTCNKVRCVVPQTTVILNSDRQNAIVAKMEDPLGSRAPDPLENVISNAVPGRRQNTIVVKVPGQEDSHNEDGESGSEASDSVSSCGQSGSQSIGNNVTLITLNSEEDYPNGTWLGDENNPEMRVRCAIIPSDMLHISTNCRTAEKMALTLLDYLFHREVQAVSNLSGQGKHGKKQLDPLTIYGIRCHLFYKFGITESDWYRIKQSIDSKCRTAWRRKQRGQSLAVKSFSRRTPSSSSYGASGRCGRGRGRPGLPGSVSPEGTLGSAEGTLGLSRGCARTTEGAALSAEPAGASLSLSPFARRPQASWGECWGAMLSCTMTGPGAFFPALSGGLVFPGEVHQEWQ